MHRPLARLVRLVLPCVSLFAQWWIDRTCPLRTMHTLSSCCNSICTSQQYSAHSQIWNVMCCGPAHHSAWPLFYSGQKTPVAKSIFARACEQVQAQCEHRFWLRHRYSKWSRAKLCEKKQSDDVICKKQHAKHNMEKLCEKKKQHCSSMMPLLRLLEEFH